MTRILSPLTRGSITLAETFTPFTSGVPTDILSPSMRRRGAVSSSLVPDGRRSTRRVSFSSTRYCFPLMRTTAFFMDCSFIN